MNNSISIDADVRDILESIARDISGGRVFTDFSDADLVDYVTA